jgi:hypothetical protein
MDFLDVLQALGSLLLSDHALTLSVLDVAHDLFIRLLLLLVLGAFLPDLQVHELVFLSRDGLLLLPSLAGRLQVVLGCLSSRL